MLGTVLATWTGQDVAAIVGSTAALVTALGTLASHLKIRRQSHSNARKVLILTRQLHRLLEIVARLSPVARQEFAALYAEQWEDAQEMAELDHLVTPRWRRLPGTH